MSQYTQAKTQVKKVLHSLLAHCSESCEFPPNPEDDYFFPLVLSVSGDRVVMTNGNPAMPQPQDVGSVSVYGPAH